MMTGWSKNCNTKSISTSVKKHIHISKIVCQTLRKKKSLVGNDKLLQYIHFEITGDPCNLIACRIISVSNTKWDVKASLFPLFKKQATGSNKYWYLLNFAISKWLVYVIADEDRIVSHDAFFQKHHATSQSLQIPPWNKVVFSSAIFLIQFPVKVRKLHYFVIWHDFSDLQWLKSEFST